MDSILTVGALFGAGVVLLVFAAGYLSAGTVSFTGTISPPPAGASCDALCNAWNSARSAACMAATAATAAASALVAATAALNGAMMTAALILAAAIATSLIPIFGPAIAGPLFAAYAVAQAAVLFLLGRQVAAAQAASSAAADSTTAMAAVAAARADLVTRCSDAAVLSRCLATPSPCPGVP